MKLLSFIFYEKVNLLKAGAGEELKTHGLLSYHSTLIWAFYLRCAIWRIIFLSIGEVQVHNDKSFIRIDFHIGLHGFTVIKHYTDRSVIIPKMQMQMSEVLDGAGDNDQDLCGYSILLLINRIYVSPHRATINMAGM